MGSSEQVAGCRSVRRRNLRGRRVETVRGRGQGKGPSTVRTTAAYCLVGVRGRADARDRGHPGYSPRGARVEKTAHTLGVAHDPLPWLPRCGLPDPCCPARVESSTAAPGGVADIWRSSHYQAKLALPPLRTGFVYRATLIPALQASTGTAVVQMTAPAGYGKTTALAAWAAEESRAVAWVSLDARDNEPRVLLGYIADALSRIMPVRDGLGAALSAPRASLFSALVPHLCSTIASAPAPFLLVLDDAHEITSSDCLEALARMIDHLPPRSQIAFSTHRPLQLRTARLAATHRIVEFGVNDLRFSVDEAAEVLRGDDLAVSEEAIVEIVERTEGWPAGVYFFARSLQAKPLSDAQASSVTSAEELVGDFLLTEDLRRLSASEMDFLVRTSVLDRLSGPLCAAILERDGDVTALLEQIARHNHFLVRISDAWYRYHHLYRDMLSRELARRDASAAAVLCQRASAWFETAGELADAVEYARQAGDTDRTARLIGIAAMPLYAAGQTAGVDAWFGDFHDPRLLDRYPAVAILAAWLHALEGRGQDALRYQRAADRGTRDEPMPDGSASKRPWLAVLHAAMCPDSIESMRGNAEAALAELAPFSQWRPTALLALGVALALAGEHAAADAALADSVDEGEALHTDVATVIALAERAIMSLDRGDVERAAGFSQRAGDVLEHAHLTRSIASVVVAAAAARVAAASGDLDSARVHVRHAQAGRTLLNHALPWLGVRSLTQLAAAYLAIGDVRGARVVQREVGELLAHRNHMEPLSDAAAALGRQLQGLAGTGDAGWAATLTAAELRLLPLLATHLSFQEIGEHLFLSRNTVKTEAIAIYRKLGATSRSAALERAVELGLLESALPARSFTPIG
jgi:LuxR family transcriptional regulator, maltose regulon positive regulatory protein